MDLSLWPISMDLSLRPILLPVPMGLLAFLWTYPYGPIPMAYPNGPIPMAYPYGPIPMAYPYGRPIPIDLSLWPIPMANLSLWTYVRVALYGSRLRVRDSAVPDEQSILLLWQPQQ